MKNNNNITNLFLEKHVITRNNKRKKRSVNKNKHTRIICPIVEVKLDLLTSMFQVTHIFILQIREEIKKGVHRDKTGIELQSVVEIIGKLVNTT